MGRGRVELKRIENKINRQVTFSKRRNGLLKKAYELSVLCDVEVALIIFSNRGRLYEFCSTSSMLKTLERYQKCNYGSIEASVPSRETQNSYQEYLKLKSKVEALQHSQRNLLGEDLGPLNSKELEHLEQQLEVSLKHVRSTKTQFMLDQLSDLKGKEQILQDANMALVRKLEGAAGSANHQQLSWENGGQHLQYGRHSGPQKDGFYHPLECDSTLQIGYNPTAQEQITVAAPAHNVNGFIPSWLV
uniref:Putative MADS-domain transcription factor AGL2 n=2 Tax=Nuphar advena TaxID=77108 RepID=A0A068LK07_NUPAD|nr:putative MADS-domain transcription factor AGL2 [Nuphar advena]